MDRALRMTRKTYASNSIVVDWDSKDYDVEGRIHRKIRRGVMTGIPGLDDQDGFYGFQPGSMTCYLGRAKAGKTSFVLLLRAIRAWEDGKKVLVPDVRDRGREAAERARRGRPAGLLRASIDLLHYMQGELTAEEQDKLRAFRADCTDEAFRIVQPDGRYTVTDLEADVERYQPDVVYIDGFYFMTDRADRQVGRRSGKATTTSRMTSRRWRWPHDPRGHQPPGAGEAAHRQEGQAGIDDGAMMGGTAHHHVRRTWCSAWTPTTTEARRTISCTRSRLQYLTTVHGTWDWSKCTFSEQAAPVRRG